MMRLERQRSHCCCRVHQLVRFEVRGLLPGLGGIWCECSDLLIEEGLADGARRRAGGRGRGSGLGHGGATVSDVTCDLSGLDWAGVRLSRQLNCPVAKLLERPT